jgi:hypothetical protein
LRAGARLVVALYFILDPNFCFALCRDQGRHKVFFRSIVMAVILVTKIPNTTEACSW